MIRIIHNKKRKFILAIVIIVLFLLSPLIIINYFDNPQVKKAKDLKDEVIRLEYFNDRKEQFEFLKNLMVEDKISYIGNKNYHCDENIYQVDKKIYVCFKDNLEEIKTLSDEINMAYKKSNIIEARIDKRNNIAYNITFLIASSWAYSVSYGYCIYDLCNSSDEVIERKDFLLIKNRIDNYWWSYFMYDGEK